MLNQLQQVTLISFLRALVELDSPLPAQLQREINEVAKMYQTQPDKAINYLIKLAESDVIKEPYQQARINIQKNYEIQERNKFDKPSQQKAPAVPPERIANIAIAIFQAPDSSKEAKNHKSEIMPQDRV
ncbi:hypothetical protein [Mastigocoleus testarum]|uniref:Uncharacterized protein n=1 Tax=Mastigocoleus testarum BC008 TaxID=371196 RepID=A0A0V7ZYA2_9CYAN|nr:hypothetical protein [Mastigocoleus testarum]KST69426.1 hypothetical protein BC008_35485 [Mastigocoleus testarum BC008]